MSKKSTQEAKIINKPGNFVGPFFSSEVLHRLFLLDRFFFGSASAFFVIGWGQRHSVDRALWALWALLVLHDLSVLRDLPALCRRLWSIVLSAPSLWKVVLWGGFSYFSDEIVGQYEWQSWAFGNLKEDNNFADVTLACEDGQQVEAHKVILAEQVLF